MGKISFQPIPLKPAVYSQTAKSDTAKNKTSFAQHLNKAKSSYTNKLVISKHAGERLEQRGIKIGPQLWDEISMKVEQAKSKGINDSLVLTKDAALIISAKNNTVITAMDRNEASSQIFTNINGAIVVD
ncbi:TIGR02530 family flagellar biosynthesis protein [Heyndrickxia acidicola]|uniref:TIGR02530 family flagellar biosynthesis protein n=1 Tax=Heyndrickxia acidicola TaxID=209389 RepID=A0ABU6MBM3_9BACI|nr:TIGR02530 family flagellar biosynthesis protein [Heyndrickxia acidicola]MED1202069.1 TIGR02530 family flagellar biosynthesis protein [Heyndrickxia acidicola]